MYSNYSLQKLEANPHRSSHLGETNGVKVLGGLLSEVEGHGLGTLSSHQAVGELVELSGLGRGGNGGKSGGGTGEGCEEGGGELGHG